MSKNPKEYKTQQYLSDDITFCLNKCDKQDCRRHPNNIRNKNISHSYAYYKNTEYCPKGKYEKGR